MTHKKEGIWRLKLENSVSLPILMTKTEIIAISGTLKKII